jgi:hypothetical protein
VPLTCNPEWIGAQAVKPPNTHALPVSRTVSKAAGRHKNARPIAMDEAPAPAAGRASRRAPLSGKKKPPAVEPLAGSVEPHGKSWTLRVRINGKQRRFRLGALSEMSETKANERAAVWRERMAREGRGAVTTARGAPGTFQNIGERWTSGELARAYPDHVKVKKTSHRDAERLIAHVYPLIGNKLVADLGLDDAEKVMQALPPATVRTLATRRHYAQLIHRILGLAVFPLRLIKVNPLPKGWLPKPGSTKAKGWLYPDEDTKLAARPWCRCARASSTGS